MIGRSKALPASMPTLTIHQVVAYNFGRAREEAGWTQIETSEQLEPFLGYRLNQAGVSAIEKTFDSERRRNIDVAEVVAFSRCFRRPVAWFFLPPPRMATHIVERPQSNSADLQKMDVCELIYQVVGFEDGTQAVRDRLAELLDTDPEVRNVLQYALSDRPISEWEQQIQLRRNAYQAVWLNEIASTNDKRIAQVADLFVELLKSTPLGFKRLQDTSTAEALRILQAGDDAVSGLVRSAELRRDDGLPSRGGFDDLVPIDPREALGLPTEV